MMPNYSIIPIVLKSTLNPGETCKIRVYITGYGTVKKHKLFVSYHPILVRIDNPGEIRFCIKIIKDKKSGKVIDYKIGKDYLHSFPLTEGGSGIAVLQSPCFQSIKNWEENPIAFPMINSEMRVDELFPVEIDINLPDKCPSGDYNLDFVLTYGDEHNIFQDKDRMSIHVTSWFERHILWTTIYLALASIALGILALKGTLF